MCAARCKCQNSIPHIRHIIIESACISILKNFVNEVDTGLCCRMVLLVEISLDLRSKPFLALHPFKIYHLFFSFQWQTRIDRCDRQVITLCQLSAQRAFTGEDFHFNMIVVHSAELADITGINIMKVDALTAFAEFSIGRRPFTRFFEIQFIRLIAVHILNIKVDNNVVLRDFHIMQSGCGQVAQLSRNFIPFGSWCLFSRSILSRTICAFSVKYRFLF